MKKEIILDNEAVEVDVIDEQPNFVLFKFEGEEYGVHLESNRDGKLVLSHKGINHSVINSQNAFVLNGFEIEVAMPSRKRQKNKSATTGSMLSPMPGKILKIFKKEGDKVLAGEAILVMEAMKMEHTIKAMTDGTIENIYFKVGDQIAAKVELVKIC